MLGAVLRCWLSWSASISAYGSTGPPRGVCCGTLRLWVSEPPASSEPPSSCSASWRMSWMRPSLLLPTYTGPRSGLGTCGASPLCWREGAPLRDPNPKTAPGRPPQAEVPCILSYAKKLENSMALPQKAAKGNAAKKTLFDLKVCVKHCRARRSGGAAATISATQIQTSACLQHHT